MAPRSFLRSKAHTSKFLGHLDGAAVGLRADHDAVVRVADEGSGNDKR